MQTATATIYEQLESLCRPKMEGYLSDLECDREMIEANPTLRFIHVTRTYGTHIFFMRPANHPSWPAKGERIKYLFSTAGRDHILVQNRECVEMFAKRAKQGDPEIKAFHYFGGAGLTHIDPDMAVTLCNEHIASVRRVWRGA